MMATMIAISGLAAMPTKKRPMATSRMQKAQATRPPTNEVQPPHTRLRINPSAAARTKNPAVAFSA